MKLNLGCGHIRPKGWVNTDSSLNSLLQSFPLGAVLARLLGRRSYNDQKAKYMNLNKKWRSFKDNSVNVVYASHLFEHLTQKSASLLLSEAYRTLIPGGVIRLVMPDLYANAKAYVAAVDRDDEKATEHFMWVLNLHKEGQYPAGHFLHDLIGWWQGWPHQHKYMYDYKSLAKMMKQVGFVDMRASNFGDSDYIKEIKEVERPGETGYEHSIYIEAKKPV